MVFDGGAYTSSSTAVIANAACFAAGPYHVPNARVDGYAVRTNNPPCGAMRGFGAVQTCFAPRPRWTSSPPPWGWTRSQLRLKNALEPGDQLLTGQVITGTAPVAEIIRAVRRAAAAARPRPGRGRWPCPGGRPHRRRGDVRRGPASRSAFKNMAFSEGFDDYSTARVRLELGADGEPVATVTSPAPRSARASSRSPSRSPGRSRRRHVVLAPADTPIGSAGSTSASARLDVAAARSDGRRRGVRERVLAIVAGTHRRWPRQPGVVGDRIVAAEGGDRRAGGRGPRRRGWWRRPGVPPRAHLPARRGRAGRRPLSFAFAAHRAVVDVDPELGLGRLVELVTSQDVGKVLNPLQLPASWRAASPRGGARPDGGDPRHGRPVRNASFTDYLIPTALDLPDPGRRVIEQAEPRRAVRRQGRR